MPFCDDSMDINDFKAQIKEPIRPELLNACIQELYQQGMRRMFLDGVGNGVDELKQLGESHGSLPIENRLIFQDLRSGHSIAMLGRILK